MSQNIDLRDIERKAWRSFYQDGLWDIFLGLLLLAMAIGALLSDIGMPETASMVIYFGLVLLAVLVVWAGKRFITAPRLGRVKFGPKRRRKLNKVSVILALSVLVAFFVAALAVKGNLLEWMSLEFIFLAGWVVNCLVVSSLMAYFLDFSRLYVIGVMYAIAVPLDIVQSEFTSIDLTFAAFGVPAAVILLSGLAVLLRFLRKYPIPAEGTLDANS